MEVDLQPLEVTSKSPFQSRLTKAGKARQLWTQYIQGDKDQSDDRAMVRDQLGGKLPQTDEETQELGLLTGRPININFGEGEAQVRVRVGQLIQKAWMRGKIARTKLKSNLGLTFNETERIEGEFDNTIDWLMRRGWSNALYATMHLAFEFEMIGISFGVFPKDWEWESYGMDQVKLQQNRRVGAQTVEAYIMREKYTAFKLASILADENATDGGWNKAAVRACLDNLSTNDRQTNNWSMEEYINEVLNNSIWYEGADASTIPILHVMVQETSGKISFLVLTENLIPKVEEHTFLCRRDERYDSMDEVIVTFIAETGAKDFQSIRGNGHRLHQTDREMNTALSLALTDLIRSGGAQMEVADEENYNKLRIKRIGNDTILGPGTKFVPRQNNIDPRGIMAARELLARSQENSTGVAYPRQDQVGPERTAAEIHVNTNTKDIIRSIEDMFFFIPYGKLIQEMVFKILRDDHSASTKNGRIALEFQKRLLTAQIPETLWRDGIESIESTAFVDELSSIDIKALVELMNMLPPTAREKMLRYIVARITGWRYAQELMPAAGPSMSFQAKVAMLETNDFAMGSEVPVLPDEPHIEHALIHSGPMQTFEEKCTMVLENQQAKPEDIQKAITAYAAAIHHLDQHLQFASQINPKPPELPALAQLVGASKNSLKRILSISGPIMEKRAKDEAERMGQGASAVDAVQQIKIEAEKTRIEMIKARTAAEVEGIRMKDKAKMENFQLAQARKIQGEDLLASQKITQQMADQVSEMTSAPPAITQPSQPPQTP